MYRCECHDLHILPCIYICHSPIEPVLALTASKLFATCFTQKKEYVNVETADPVHEKKGVVLHSHCSPVGVSNLFLKLLQGA